jgi:hypothetical protein
VLTLRHKHRTALLAAAALSYHTVLPSLGQGLLKAVEVAEGSGSRGSAPGDETQGSRNAGRLVNRAQRYFAQPNMSRL